MRNPRPRHHDCEVAALHRHLDTTLGSNAKPQLNLQFFVFTLFVKLGFLLVSDAIVFQLSCTDREHSFWLGADKKEMAQTAKRNAKESTSEQAFFFSILIIPPVSKQKGTPSISVASSGAHTLGSKLRSLITTHAWPTRDTKQPNGSQLRHFSLYMRDIGDTLDICRMAGQGGKKKEALNPANNGR